MSILLPQDWRWRTPLPQRIDWSNPLTRGLGRLVTPSSGLQNVAENNIASAINNVVRNPLGFSGTVGSASAIVLSDFATTRYTCLFVAVTYSAGALEPRMVTRSGGAPTYNQNYALNLNGGITPRAGHKQVSNNAYPYVQSSISVPAGGICVGVSTYDGSNIKVFTNGRLGGSVAASDPYTSLGASVATQFLNSDGTSRFADAAYRGPGFLLGAIWNRALTDDEVADISANPWQLFQPLRGIPIAFDTGGGTQTLTPSLYTNNQTFYSPTVTSTATVQPARYDNTNVFYSPTVSAKNTLTPARYDNSQVFYGPTVTSTATIAPARYDNTNVFYSPTVSLGTSILYPDRFDNTNTFYAASIINEYPDPSQVLEGVHYGPGGILVGTLTGGGGSSIIRLRSFTERH